jgi:hypothetical protein
MNIKTDEETVRWGLAFVRKSPLPAEGTWTEVPYYTYIIGDNKTYYKAKQKDFPVELTAIESYPVLDSFVPCNYEIKPAQSVFIDWRGNYFIGKTECFNLQPENITVIYRDNSILDKKDQIPVLNEACVQFVPPKWFVVLNSINDKYKTSQKKVRDEKQHRTAS